jgi:hypothetical protein
MGVEEIFAEGVAMLRRLGLEATQEAGFPLATPLEGRGDGNDAGSGGPRAVVTIATTVPAPEAARV